MRNHERGSALLISIIMITVITIIGVGIIRFGSREIAGSIASTKSQALVACADAARQALVSRFHAVGLKPSQIAPLNLGIDNPNVAQATTLALGGHYDENGGIGGLTLAQVSRLPDTTPAAVARVGDITGRAGGAGSAGQAYKVVVHCQQGGNPTDPTSGRQLEVELGVWFGL